MAGFRHTLVLLHPFPLDATFWAATWRELDADVNLLTPQFPGFGGDGRQDDVSVASYADQVAELILREADGPAIVCGLSLGGYVALALAADHLHVLCGLLLANTKAEADSEEAKAGRDAGIDTIRIDGLETFLGGLVPKLVATDASPQIVDRVHAIASAQDAEAVIQALAALRDRRDRTDVLSTITVPTAVVTGSEDVLMPMAVTDALVEGIAGATKHVIPGAGHLSAIERPAEFAAVLRELIARVPQPD